MGGFYLLAARWSLKIRMSTLRYLMKSLVKNEINITIPSLFKNHFPTLWHVVHPVYHVFFELHSSTGSFHIKIGHELSPDSNVGIISGVNTLLLTLATITGLFYQYSLATKRTAFWMNWLEVPPGAETGGLKISINQNSNLHKSLGFCDQFGSLPNLCWRSWSTILPCFFLYKYRCVLDSQLG